MAGQTFLCYARKDREQVESLHTWLESEGFTPWMDKKRTTPGDRWCPGITEAIHNSTSFLFLMSPASVDSKGRLRQEIKREIELALRIQKLVPETRFIIPVRLKDCALPAELSGFDSADLFDSEQDRLLGALALQPETPPGTLKRAKPQNLCGLRRPCFFPAISSTAKSTLSPLQHLEVLSKLDTQYLFSAYDILNKRPLTQKKIKNILRQSMCAGNVVLLDSGLYEKKWAKGKWLKKHYQAALSGTTFNMAFAYDVAPQKNMDKFVARIIRSLEIDKQEADLDNVIPVLHVENSEQYPELCASIAQKCSPIMMAVPERELGDGIFEACETIHNIRMALDKSEPYIPLHVLGAGNPRAVLLYAACGADSFDGLDWCQTVADFETGKLHHRMQLDFFAHQSEAGKEKDMTYSAKVLGHNIEFYKYWMDMIQQSIANNTLVSKLADYLPKTALNFIETKMPLHL